ncbi:MBL fold metallo-hydrolase [Vibrio parahaemolyticus]|uniref:MBL fold metallo-hydrolase n=1 Tax=Vibrio mediterranei TaxID=689 RepID=UPI0040692E92
MTPKSLWLLVIALHTLTGCSDNKSYTAEQGFDNGRFTNDEVAPNDVGLLDAIYSIYVEGSPFSVPNEDLPVRHPALDKMEQNAAPSFVKIGHSTILLRLGGHYWLFDPVFSERASPSNFIGPKRYTPPAMQLEDIPKLKAIIISHNHFDHLDEASIKTLIGRTDHFYVPLGVKSLMSKWGINDEAITELGWWNESSLGEVSLAAVPSQHFSGRSLTDKNTTLWVSWVLFNDTHRIYFSGDSGYFSGFRQIGDKYGPFDITLMENGAYNTLWQTMHLFPKETVQAHIDLRGKYLVPIHNATFNLSTHAWFDPLEKIDAIASERNVTLITPRFGDVVTIDDIERFQERWWRDYLPKSNNQQ